MKQHYVINVGRQLGSGGREIGERVARDLGLSYYDRKLIELAARKSGFCEEFFEKADEKSTTGFWSGLFGLRYPFVNNSVGYNDVLSNDSLFKIQSDVIRSLADKESCLFVGRCADYILRDYPHCINVFISASPEQRVARLCRQDGMTADAAAELIEKSDKERAEYYNYYGNKMWGEASSYDLCLNSTTTGIDGAVAMIERFAELCFGTQTK